MKGRCDVDMNRLGERLKNLRENRGITQKFLAEKIGVKANTLSGYESGRREPDAETLRKMADYYEVTMDYLLGRTRDPKFSQATEKIVNDIDLGSNVDDLMKKYNLMFNGEKLPKEDVEKITQVVKTLMSMKK